MVFFGCAIFPHGCMVLDPTKQDLPEGAQKLHENCKTCADEIINNIQPDIIVLSTPHGINLSKSVGIYTNNSASGSAEWNNDWINFKVNVELDDNLSNKLLQYLESLNLDVQGITSFAKYDAHLRWGEVVPLWFLTRTQKSSSLYFCLTFIETKFIIITPPSKPNPNVVDERKKSLLQFGASMRAFFEKIEQRVFFVVSGDLSHTHPTDYKNPLYLPNPLWNLPQLKEESSLFDSLIENWVKTKDEVVLLEKAVQLDKVALSCGLQGFILLHGVLQIDLQNWDTKVFANIAPTYFELVSDEHEILLVAHGNPVKGDLQKKLKIAAESF